jgi:hypothetical protein
MVALNGIERVDKMNFGDYTLFCYRKPVIDASLKTFRSVVMKEGAVVCFSPPQSISLGDFRDKHPSFDKVTVEPFIDGTMINAFHDAGEWIFCTKRNVGATNRFYEKSFLELLKDVELPEMDPAECYSFVLQHAGCRNVVPVKKNRLVLVVSYRINGMHATETRHLPRLRFDSYDAAIKSVVPSPWYVKGCMLVCGEDRAKIMPTEFIRVSRLKGNDSQFGYRYAELAQKNLLREYGEKFPERRQDMAVMRRKMVAFTENLFRYFRQPRSPYAYRPHVAALRQYQSSCLAPIPLTRVDVDAYVSAMPPARLMYALNHTGH